MVWILVILLLFLNLFRGNHLMLLLCGFRSKNSLLEFIGVQNDVAHWAQTRNFRSKMSTALFKQISNFKGLD